MNSDCKILTLEEEELVDANRYNFRRWSSEELQRKQSPFERGTKREFPFLFQKKRAPERKDTKTSLEDICTQLNNVKIHTYELNTEVYLPSTPPYPPYSASTTPLLMVNEVEPTVDISNNLLLLS